MNDFFIVNRNLNAPVGTDANGRTMYGTVNPDGRVSVSYLDQTLYGESFNGGVYELLNTSNNRPHRVVVSGTYTMPWRSLPTDILISYVGQSGQPYTLLARGSSGRGDLNADGTNSNDPIYLPNDATTEMIFEDITASGGAVTHTAAELPKPHDPADPTAPW